MDLRQRIYRFVLEQALLPPDGQLVVGVSGGPDSLCLLDVLHKLSAEWKLTLLVAHLNHGLRAEAEAEAETVRAEASQRGLAFHTAKVDTRAHARIYRLSVEEAARELRYAFFAQVARAAGAATLATAHTADDQAETVLMHFLRGAGLNGLRGMRPKSQIPNPKSQGPGPKAQIQNQESEALNPKSKLWLIRPLLGATRAEIEAYCAEQGLQPVRDATNLDTAYFRNRLRHALLPELENYNPNLRAGLRRTADVLAGEYELLRGLVDRLWATSARLEADRVIFDRPNWLKLSVPEQRALLREAIARLQGHARDIDFAPVENAVQFSRRATPGRRCEVLGRLRLWVTYSQLILSAKEISPLPMGDWPLLDEANQLAPGWQFLTTPLERSTWSLAQLEASATQWRVYIDAARLSGPGRPRLSLRPRRPGDRFQPLGLGGRHQKISDTMVNVKLEADLRDRWPLVTCGEAIVWLAGLRLDERFKVTAETENVVQLEFVREGAGD